MWKKRYFVLHGATLAYYDDEAAAEAADEAKARLLGTVVHAKRWPQVVLAKPAQVPDAIFAARPGL